jgi:hypothetical protein
VAPVALAGAIMPGLARFIDTPSLHAAELGVGTTERVGSILVLPSSVIAGWIVPGGGPAGISGVESGNVAPLIEEVAVVEIHPLANVEPPSGVIGAMVPVALPLMGMGVVADGASGIGVVAIVLATAGAVIAPATADVEGPVTGGGTGIGGAVTTPRAAVVVVGWIVTAAAAGSGAIAPGAVIVPRATAEVNAVVAVTGTGLGVIVVVCANDGEQLMLVPAMVGSSASGTGARVVTGAPGIVAAEKGLGPVRGDDTIAPGVDGIPMAVVPMVDTCAAQGLPPSSNAVIA